jgi:hypothetical protein
VTVIQQVLFELDGSYLGHPYFVTGHALYNALARRVDDRVRRALQVSHGVFLPGEYGSYPEGHSESGYAGKLGSELPSVEAYEDLFLLRDGAQRWLQESRPRDAHNVQDVVSHGGRLAFAEECWFGRPERMRNHRRSVSWYVQCYLHGGRRSDDVIPVAAETLDGVRVGGARNYGFGELSVVDTQVVDLDALSFEGLAGAEAYWVELVTPFVVASAYPGADDQDVPWWWDTQGGRTGSAGGSGRLRERETRLVTGDEAFRVETIDHGQVVGYDGDRAIETARNGVVRVGTHSRYGFGELRVRPAGRDRVQAYADDEVEDSGVEG